MAEKSAKLSTDPDSQAASELVAPRWSVVSFERREAASQTYAAAAKKIEELDRKGVTGLCIITDEAADRLEATAKR